MATSFSSELRRNYGPIILRVVLCATVAALIGKSYCADSTVSSSTENVFLKIAHDPNATAAQKETIAILIKEAAVGVTPEWTLKKIQDETKLIHQGAEDQKISDLSPLTQLTHLETLVLSGNGITDLTPLAGLTNLKTLALEHNAITDITPLRFLKKLESLELDYNSITDLTPLAGLTNLKTLNLNCNSIAEINPLRFLKRLENLSITNNKISDISALAALRNLQTLSISNNKISNIQPLADLHVLRDLDLSGNPVKNLTPLSKLSLSNLEMQGCELENIGDLHQLNQKIDPGQTLDLSDNKIKDIAALGKLNQVYDLNLSNNKIASIEGLKNAELTQLDLTNNKISDVSALANLPKLVSVNLKNNPIKNYGPLIALAQARPGINIVADKKFDDALSQSRPTKEELRNSPIIGKWRSGELYNSFFGPHRIEMSFEKNGQFKYRMLPPIQDDSSDDEDHGSAQYGTFRVENNILETALGGETHTKQFEILGNDLILKYDDQPWIKLTRQK